MLFTGGVIHVCHVSCPSCPQLSDDIHNDHKSQILKRNTGMHKQNTYLFDFPPFSVAFSFTDHFALPSLGLHYTPSGTERLQVEPPVPRERSESPGVPPVAESVEIMTAPTDTVTRQTEAAFKRTASNWERQRAKNPRLTEGWQLLCVYMHMSVISVSGKYFYFVSLSFLLMFCYQDNATVSFQDPLQSCESVFCAYT